MQHRNDGGHEFRFGKAGADMFCRTLYRRIHCIQIHCARIFNIAGHHRTLEEMDIVHFINDARGIINIGQIGFAVRIIMHIDHMHRRTCGAVMHARTRQQQIMLGVLTTQGDITRRNFQSVFDQCPRKTNPAVITCNRARFDHIFNARFWRLTEANFF